MSYILEALKKAQAERQLGSAPTIHAPQAAAPVAHGGAAGRKSLLVGLGAGALVVAAGALLLWRQHPAAPVPLTAAASGAASVAAPASAPAAAPASPAVAHGGARPAVQAPDRPADTLALSTPPAPALADDAADAGAAAARTRAPARAAGPATAPPPARGADTAAVPPAPAALSVAPLAASTSGSRTAASSSTAPIPAPRAPAPSAAPAARVAAGPVPAAAPAAARAPAPEDNLPFLQQLPDAQQRDLPRVTFGGYMYSANPADRLLLVDKALRHEGEEVAPGLVLEKLLPKAAVMNYRGLRYRVAY